MIKIKGGKWVGLDTLAADELKALRPQAEVAVFRGARHFVNEIKRTLTGPRSGRPYKVSRTGRTHIAAAPGQPPAVLFGNLRNSVGHTDPKWTGLTISAEVGPGLTGGDESKIATGYARRQEYGGVDSRGVYVPAHPYMEPTAVRVEPQLDQIFEGAFT
jgi:hypothetical protein